MQITQIAKSYVATSVFLLPTTRSLGNGSIVVARLAVVNKERRRNKHRLKWWWRLLETCACDVVIVLASATKQVMYSKKELERSGLTSIIPSCDRTQGRLYTRRSLEYCDLASQRALWRELLMQAGCVCRLCFLSFFLRVNKVQFQQCCQGYQRLSTREEGNGGVR